jgi:hypothetical protein
MWEVRWRKTTTVVEYDEDMISEMRSEGIRGTEVRPCSTRSLMYVALGKHSLPLRLVDGRLSLGGTV